MITTQVKVVSKDSSKRIIRFDELELGATFQIYANYHVYIKTSYKGCARIGGVAGLPPCLSINHATQVEPVDITIIWEPTEL